MTTLAERTIEAAARIAKIPEMKKKAFSSLLTVAVREAHRVAKVQHRPATIKLAKPYFDKLRKALSLMRPQAGGRVAGAFLDAVLAPASIEDLLCSIDRAERFAATQLPRRGAPKGPRNAPGFQSFVSLIVISTYQLGGKLTCNRKPEGGGVDGTFIKMLGELSDELPPGFIPESGRTIERAFQAAKLHAK